MMSGKKPSLALVIGASKPDDGDSDESEDESSEDYTEAAGELFEALKADDKEAFAEAFKAAVMSCKM